MTGETIGLIISGLAAAATIWAALLQKSSKANKGVDLKKSTVSDSNIIIGDSNQISIIKEQHVHRPPPELTNLSLINRITLAEIRSKINAAPLYHQDSIAKSFVGLEINCEAALAVISSHDLQDSARVIFAVYNPMFSFHVNLNLNDYPRLKSANSGDQYRVSGHIKEIIQYDSVLLEPFSLEFIGKEITP